MKKIVLILIGFAIAHQLIAQETATTCAEGKLKAYQSIKKKSRASNFANALMSQYDVHFYYLDIAAERNSTNVSGFTTIGATITSASLDTFCFELNQALTLDSILYNNQSISFIRNGAISYAILPAPVLQNANISIQIFYKGNASLTGGSAIGDGFSTGTSGAWGNQATWSLSEPYSAYEWFPCKQFLQDKADSAWVFVTTDNLNKVGSNGTLEGVDTLPNNKVKYRWKTHYAIDYYLISVAIARYVEYTTYAHPASLPNDSIPIVNYIYNNPNTLPFLKPYLDSLGMMVEYFSDRLGLYPFYGEKYGHCMAPFSGGMEHQTMTSVGFLQNFSLNAHELVHQWFGDHVTCKTWKDIFINEGFASYGEYLAFEHFYNLAAAQTKMLGVHNNVLQDNNATVYFTDTTDVNRIFDSRLTYDKGSAVVHTLRFVLGDSLFFAGLKNFQTQYSFSTASIDDLHSSLQAFTGINLNDYFDQWIYGSGSPVFYGQYYSDGNNIYIKVNESTTSTATPLFKTPLEIRCLSASGDTIIKVDITQNLHTFIIPSSKIISGIKIDPNNWILNKEGQFALNQSLSATHFEDNELGNQLTIYPNPVNDFVEINSNNSEKIDFILMNSQGQKIRSGNFTKLIKLDTGNLNSGIYFIEMNSAKAKTVKKIVKL